MKDIKLLIMNPSTGKYVELSPVVRSLTVETGREINMDISMTVLEGKAQEIIRTLI